MFNVFKSIRWYILSRRETSYIILSCFDLFHFMTYTPLLCSLKLRFLLLVLLPSDGVITFWLFLQEVLVPPSWEGWINGLHFIAVVQLPAKTGVRNTPDSATLTLHAQKK